MTVQRSAALSRAATASTVARVVTVLLAATVALNVVYAVGLVAGGGSPSPVINVGVALATQWVPATIFWIVAATTAIARLPVLLAAGAITLTALGDTYYSFAMDADGYLPFPSPADIVYLLFYPLMIASLLALVRSRFRGVRGLLIVETGVGTLGAAAVLTLVLDPIVGDALASGELLSTAIALAYPTFDVVLLAVIAGVASLPTARIGRRWWALVGGLSVWAAADIAYALLEHEGAYLAGLPLDAAWAVGLALLAWWVAGVPGWREDGATTVAPRLAVPVPAIAVLAGLAVLVVGTRMELSLVAVVLAAATIATGTLPLVFRQALLGRMLAARDEAMRRLSALDRAKTEIMVTMNHEFRTPLTTITGHVELLVDGGAGELPPAAVNALQTVERNAERLESLIDETLVAARLEEGEEYFAREPIELGSLVAAAGERVRATGESRGVALDLVGTDASLPIDGDPAHLERALGNLLDNAVKFSDRGDRVTVTVDAAGRSDAVVRIVDTGIGIPDEDLPRLFRRYFRASNVRSAAIPGIGLGLSIAQHVVRAHGGAIVVESELDEGTTVTVRLPRRRDAQARRERVPASTAPATSSTAPTATTSQGVSGGMSR